MTKETVLFQFTTDNYETLVKEYWRTLYAIAYRRLSDEDLAKDMVQEVFAYCWQKRDIIQIHTNVKAYLRITLKHLLMAHFRKIATESRAFDELYQRMKEVEVTIRDIMTEIDLKRTLTTEIETMPLTMQQVFKLRMDEYTIDEIAQSLDVSKKTVKNNVSLGLNRIRKAIAKDFPADFQAISLALYILLT